MGAIGDAVESVPTGEADRSEQIEDEDPPSSDFGAAREDEDENEDELKRGGGRGKEGVGFTIWLKEERASSGQGEPAIWAMANKGRQLSARRLKAVGGNCGSQAFRAAKLSAVQRASLRQSSLSISVR